MEKKGISSEVKDETGAALINEVYAPEYVTYNAKKHVSQLDKSGKAVSNDVKVEVDGAVMKYATFKCKFKNNKLVAADASKRPFFTLSFKANKSATKEQKNYIKLLNKELKNKRAYFDIRKADLSQATNVVAKMDKKRTKISALTVTIGSDTMKLSKKDFTYTAKDGGFEVTGIGNCTGTLFIP